MQPYMHQIARFPLLTPERERELARQVRLGAGATARLTQGALGPHAKRKLRDAAVLGREARRRMIESNLRLVIATAAHFEGRGLSFEDLVAEGNCGLIAAVDRFDERKGFRFSTYATWWIIKALWRAVAHQSQSVPLPVHAYLAQRRLTVTQAELQHELGRPPTETETARALNLSAAALHAIQRSGREPERLEQQARDGEDEEVSTILEQPDPVIPDDEVCRNFLHRDLRVVLKQLRPSERRVLELRFGLCDDVERSLAEVGRELGITRERARQVEQGALERLRGAPVVTHLVDYLV
jgi:RNA polymerase primary sigma factor